MFICVGGRKIKLDRTTENGKGKTTKGTLSTNFHYQCFL